MEVYRERRARVSRRLPADALMLISGGAHAQRSNDTDFRFRPNSDFHYLTGLAEPDGALLIRGGGAPEAVLFVRPRDRAAEIWAGRRLGPEAAKAQAGVEDAMPIASLEKEIQRRLSGVREVHLDLHQAPFLAPIVLTATRALQRQDRAGVISPTRLVDLRAVMGEERLVKDAAALGALRYAIDLSARGHREAAAHLRPGQFEYEFEARLEYEFRRHGSTGPGYGSIVGAGDNANILHYVDNNGRIDDGDVLLVDAGCEWELFTGDITRCYPASGNFSAPQRALYDVVLRANEAGIHQTVVGNDINAIHDHCVEILVDGMIDLGLLRGPRARCIEQGDYKRFYMHRTSHWLGVDVHDVGTYCVDGVARPLAPGHVITVEPGLYVASDAEDVPDAFRGIGIRLEDDVLVTADGPEILSARAPKAPDEVEDLVGSAR